MKSLPENHRISLYLYYYEQYTTKEIAACLSKSETAVNQYLSRGRRKLRQMLDNERSAV